jgi:hypothetical protein
MTGRAIRDVPHLRRLGSFYVPGTQSFRTGLISAAPPALRARGKGKCTKAEAIAGGGRQACSPGTVRRGGYPYESKGKTGEANPEGFLRPGFESYGCGGR